MLRRLVIAASLMTPLGVIAPPALSAPAGASTSCTVNWTGAAKDQQWTTAGNWSPARVPNSSDVACIPSTYRGPTVADYGSGSVASVSALGSSGLTIDGSLKVSQPSTVEALALVGTLTVASGAGLALSGTSYLENGYLDGPGATTVPTGSLAYWLGGNVSSPLTNQGTIDWYSGDMCLNGTGAVTNDGTIDVRADNAYLDDCATSKPGLTNTAGATLVRDGTGSLNSIIGVPFTNLSTVTDSTGDLELDSGNVPGSTDSGAYSLAAGTTLTLGGGIRTLTSAATITGQGTLDVTLTDLALAGQTLSTVQQSGGALEGAFTVSGSDLWTGGAIQNIGTKATTSTIGAQATMTIEGGPELLHHLLNKGVIDWVSGSPCLGNNALLTNDRTMNLTADEGYLDVCDTSTPGLTNAKGATINRSGARGTCAYVDLSFSNAGSVKVASADLQLGGGNTGTTTDTGSYSIASGGAVILSAGTRTLATTATVAGGGVFEVDGATVVFSGQTVPSLDLLSGSAEGALTLSGNALFQGGTMSDAGAASSSTVIASGATAVIAGNVVIQHSLTNSGSLTWASGDPCFADGNSPTTFTNEATFKITAYLGDSGPCGGNPTWVNAAGATWTVNVPGTATEKYLTTNDGTVDLDQGTLHVANSWVSASGSTLGTTVDGTASPAFGQMMVDSNVTLAGALDITTPSSYAPQPGDGYPVAVSSANAVTGTFSSVTGTSLPNGDSYSVVYSASAVTLDVSG